MRKRALSIHQQLTCCFIHTYTQAHGFPPTVREIGRWVGFGGIRSITLALASLEDRGYVKRQPHTRRSICLTPQGVALAQQWQLTILDVA